MITIRRYFHLLTIMIAFVILNPCIVDNRAFGESRESYLYAAARGARDWASDDA